MRSKKRLLFLKFLLCAFLIGTFSFGCAYYNTFFNAKKEFNAAAKERKKRTGDKASSQENGHYNKAIEKASAILELHSNSKYVDDALFMIGQCFYYQKQYVKAERKFNELIELYGESNLYDNSLLWRAKSRIEIKKYTDAMNDCRELNSNSSDQSLKDEAQFCLALIAFSNEEYEEAIELYKSIAAEASDKQIRANTYFKLGESYNELDDYASASNAFQNAIKFSPSLEFRYITLLELGKAQKLSGNNDLAIKTFNRILDDNAAKEYWLDTEIEVADALYKKGEIKDAINNLKYLIEENSKTVAAGKAHYYLGKIYEDYYFDYEQAKFHYDLVKKTAARSEVGPLAITKSGILEKVLLLREKIALLNAPVDTTAIESEQEPVEDNPGINEDLPVANERRRRQNNPNEMPPSENRDDGGVRNDTMSPRAQGSNMGRENTQYQTRDTKQSGNKKKEEVEEFIRGSVKPKVLLTPKDNLDITHLQLGEVYYFQFNQPDTALKHYQAAYNEARNDTIAATALFSISYIYEHDHRNIPKSDSLLRLILTNYPQTLQAEGARQRLDLPLTESAEDTIEYRFYAVDKALWTEDKADMALSLYQKIIDDYPETEYAAKALYGQGWIWEKHLHENEKAYEFYNTLLEQHPQSSFALRIKPKIDTYNNKDQILQEAVTDSTLALAADSLSQQQQLPARDEPLTELAEMPASLEQDVVREERRKDTRTDEGALIIKKPIRNGKPPPPRTPTGSVAPNKTEKSNKIQEE